MIRQSQRFFIVFFILLLLDLVLGGLLTPTITASSYLINDATTYTVILSATQRLTDSCVILFTFPAASGINFQSPLSCTKGSGFLKDPTCTVTQSGTGLDFVVKAACTSTGTIDPTSAQIYRLQIINIKNSFSAQSVTNIDVKTFSGSTLLDQGTASIQFQSKTLPSGWGRLSTLNPSVGVYSDLTLYLTITTPVPYDGQIIFVLPKWDSQGRKSMADQVSSCRTGSDINGNSPTCTTTYNSPRTNFDQVTIKNAMLSYQTSTGSQVPSSKLLEVTISQIRNPPTQQTYTNFEIYTADKLGNLIETCSGLSLVLMNPGSLNSLSSVALTGNTGINQMGTYKFFFKLGNPLPSGSWVRVVFPSDVAVLSPSYQDLLTGQTSATLVQSTVQVNNVNRVAIDIKNAITSYIQEESAIYFQISGIQNPTSAKPTLSFQFLTSDALNSWVDQLITGLTVTATQGSLKSVKIYPSDQTGVLQYAKVYQLQFTTANPLTSANSIILHFPLASFTVNSRTCTVNGTIGSATVTTSAVQCVASYDTSIVTIKNIITSSSVQGGTGFVLTVQNLYIRNPASVSESQAIEVYTALDGYKVDYDATQKFTANWAPINSASISASSLVTNQQDVTYTFTVNPSGYLITTAVINVTFPDEIRIGDQDKLSRQCGLTQLSGFKGTLDCSVKNSNQVIIQYGFSNGLSDDPPTLIFSLPGIINPRQFNAPSSTFVISIYDGFNSNKVLYNISSGVTVTMTKLSTIQSVQLSRDSQINGDLTNYTFKLQFSGFVQNGDYLILESPKGQNTISYSNTTKCLGISANLYYNQVCSTQSGGTQLKLKFSTRFLLRRQLQSYSSSYQNLAYFIITDVKNPPSLQKTATFVITQYSSNDIKVEDSSTYDITVQNNQTGNLSYQQFQVIPLSYQTGKTTPYQVTFDPQNYVQDMYLVISIPSELKVSDQIRCDAITGVSTDINCQYNVQNRTLIVRQAFSSSTKPNQPIKFTISNLTNPDTEIKTSDFKIISYTSDGYAIDQQDSGVYLDFKCSLPCAQCLPKNNTGCTACFIDGSKIGLPRHLYQNYCIDKCPISTFAAPKDLSCQSCYDPKICLRCTSEQKNACLQCTDDFTLVNGTCVKLNDQTYFFPVLILSCIWLLASLFITLNWHQSRYLATAILGLTVMELILMIIELCMQKYYKFDVNFKYELLSGIVAQYPANVAFLLFYIIMLRNMEEIKESRQLDTKLHCFILICGALFSQRSFKLLYSSMGNKPYLGVATIFSQPKVKWSYCIIQLLSIVPSVLLILNALNNWKTANSVKLKFPTLIDLERVIVSGIVIFLHVIELFYLDRPRPQFIDNIIAKYHGQQPQVRATRITPREVDEKPQYNEIPSVSFATQQDGPPPLGSIPHEEVKRQAMKQVLENLKVVKPELIEDRLQELLQAQQAKLGGSPLRKSDPANPFSPQRKGYKTLKKSGNPMDEAEDDRRVITEPITPKTIKKLGGQRGALEEFQNQETFPMDPKLKKQVRDQEVLAAKSRHSSLDREWNQIKQEKEELQRLRQQIEKERAEIENMKKDQEILAASNQLEPKQGSSPDNRLEEVNRREIYTHRSRNQQILDAVRESQSELIEDERGRRSQRQKTLSKDRSLPGTFSGTRESAKSNNSEIARMTPNPHKCHGQSQDTIKSINRLRKKTGSSGRSSINDSRSNHNRLRAQGTAADMFTSPKNVLQYLNSNLEDQLNQPPNSNQKLENINQVQNSRAPAAGITKIYYSDKTESSVDELMDETPSNYNLHNGRFDGKSTGGGAYQLQNKEGRKIVARLGGPMEVSKKAKKKKKRQFNEESTTNERETVDEYMADATGGGNSQQDSRSHSVIRIRPRGQVDRDIDQLSRVEGAISNMSTEQNERSRVSNLNKKRGSQSNARIDGIIPMSNDRIRALEAAYLTKLQRPKLQKPTPKSRQLNNEQVERNYTEIINLHRQTMSQRDGLDVQAAGEMTLSNIPATNSDLGLNLTQVKVLPVPQINNFNQQ